MRKPFDKALYDIADTKAKKQMVGWLKDHDHSNISTDVTYYFDIVCTVEGECPDDILTFVVFRNDCKKAWHIDGQTLLDCEVKEVSNRNIQKGEKFFHIPTSDAYLMDMTYDESSR